MGELSVVRQYEQSLAVGVEPADMEEPLRHVGDQIAHSRSTARIGHCAQHATRLVQCQVDQVVANVDPDAVDPNHRNTGIDPDAHLRDDPAVDLDPPGSDQLLAPPPGPDTGGRQYLLQPDALARRLTVNLRVHHFQLRRAQAIVEPKTVARPVSAGPSSPGTDRSFGTVHRRYP